MIAVGSTLANRLWTLWLACTRVTGFIWASAVLAFQPCQMNLSKKLRNWKGDSKMSTSSLVTLLTLQASVLRLIRLIQLSRFVDFIWWAAEEWGNQWPVQPWRMLPQIAVDPPADAFVSPSRGQPWFYWQVWGFTMRVSMFNLRV